MYEIVKSIADFSGGLLTISQNTIYTAAYKLGNDGRISEYSTLVGRKGTGVYYRIESAVQLKSGQKISVTNSKYAILLRRNVIGYLFQNYGLVDD